MLCSPIILADHPEIARRAPARCSTPPRSTRSSCCRTLALGDDEKDEARRTDPRARELIDRVDGLAPEIRAAPRCDPFAPAGRTDRGDPRSRSSPARSWVPAATCASGPGRNADAQDLFWAGRSAVVTEVRHDVDGHTHVAVLADDDPGADVRAWQGRYLYFDPAELEVLDGGAP